VADPQERLLIIADRLVDGTGRAALGRSFVAIEGERIAAVGPAEEAERRISAPARRLEFATCTVLPGFVDSHVHLTFSAGPVPFEMELLLGAGWTPLEAIRAATLDAAIAIGLDKEIGTVEVGKVADLVVVRGDPARSVSDARQVMHVLRSGRVVASAGQLTDDRRPVPWPSAEIAERSSLWRALR
jgi:imidazolonepropionase-like amidohydrolase